jgi:hypothetical protein
MAAYPTQVRIDKKAADKTGMVAGQPYGFKAGSGKGEKSFFRNGNKGFRWYIHSSVPGWRLESWI